MQGPVQWFKWVDDKWKSVTKIDGNVYRIVENDELFIENVNTNDAGKYMCVYITDFGTVQRVNKLNVRKRATEHDEPFGDDIELEGDSIILRCDRQIPLEMFSAGWFKRVDDE